MEAPSLLVMSTMSWSSATKRSTFTHRQFDPSCEAITRRPLREVSQPWHAAQPVCIGQTDPMIGTDLHAIPANWRELAEAVPPGDAIGWPYPGPWPAENPQPKE
jgi:hypothetical protein